MKQARQEYMDPRPHFVATNADKQTLINELEMIDRDLAEADNGTRTPAMTWAERQNLQARRAELKRLIAEIAATEHQQLTRPAQQARNVAPAQRSGFATQTVTTPDGSVTEYRIPRKAGGCSGRKPKGTAPKAAVQEFVAPDGEVVTGTKGRVMTDGYAAP